MSGAETAGGNTITADTAAGIKTTRMSAATVKAGTIVTTVAAAGIAAGKDAATVMATVTINAKRSLPAPFSFRAPMRCQ
jgi:hypothetical protein